MRRLHINPTLRLVLTYTALGGAWILFSGHLLALLVRAPGRFTALQIFKGWAYTIISAGAMIAMIQREIKERRQTAFALVTQRRQEEEKLRLLQSAFAQIGEGLVVATADFEGAGPRIVTANPSWCRHYANGATDVVGKPPLDFIGREFGPAEIAQIRRALRAGRVESGDSRHLRPDGSTVAMEWTIAPITDAAGKLTHFVAVTRDVTERRRGQEELERYRLMSDSANTIVLFSDPTSYRIVDANAAALHAYGYTRAELLQMSSWQLRATAEHPRNLEQVLAQGGGKVETVHRRKNGQTFPALVTITIAQNSGQPLMMFVVQDITRQKQLEAMQELLHNIDHRILQKQGLDEILQYACEQVAALFGFPLAWIGLKQPDGTVREAAIAGTGKVRMVGLVPIWDPEPNGPTGRAVRTGQEQFIRLKPDPRLAEQPDRADLFGPWYCLSLPLLAEDRIEGALSLYAMEDGVFDDAMIQHLRQFANQVALSMLAARNQEQINLQTQALEAAANAVLIADAAGRVLWVNRAWSKMTGFTAAETVGWIPDDLTAGGVQHTSREARRKDGTLFYMDQTITPVCDSEGRVTHIVAIAQDVTERRQQEEHLRFLALHDPLTGLPNRRALQEGLERMIARSSKERCGAMILLDLDHFKVVNDTLGDAGGDDLLIALTRLLQTSLRDGDLLTRFGGDQFAVLVGPITPEAARARAEGLRHAVSELRFQRHGRTVNVSASVGVAMIDGSLDASAVKALANAALVAAKEAGKNQVTIYRSEWDKPTDLAEENRLAALIKDALREDRFCLHFQPVVALGTGHTDHYEVLIRLRQPDGTILLPGAFLGAAERFRLMPAIDRWVLERALAHLRQRPWLHLFVNLSGQSLSDESLLADTEARLRHAGDLAARLSIEVTETTAVRDMERLKIWMSQLKGLGCRFALDDFGIGFSSFAYLRILPADYIKLDGSFIKNLDTDPTNRSLVEAMCTAAHTLGKVVVAEWVENEAIARVLREIGVEYGQGYRWGKPLPELPED